MLVSPVSSVSVPQTASQRASRTAFADGTLKLAFRVLQDHLGLPLLWSAKTPGIGTQLWASVCLAQVLHALQVQVASDTGVATFEVSLEVLSRYLPALSQSSLLQSIHERGSIKLIRPSTRIQRHVRWVDWQELLPPPPDVRWIRVPRQAYKTNDTPSRHCSRSKQEPGVI